MLTNRFTHAKNAAVVLLLVMSAQLFTLPSVQADDAQAKSSGILPLPDYSGDLPNVLTCWAILAKNEPNGQRRDLPSISITISIFKLLRMEGQTPAQNMVVR